MNYDTLSAERTLRTELPFEQQFMDFTEAAEQGLYTQQWLCDPDSRAMIYVRQNTRPIGPPIPGFEQFLSDVDCLEISNLEYRDKIDPVSVSDFTGILSKIYALSSWKVICLDQLEQHGSRELTKWCTEHGWQIEEKTGIIRIFLPDRPVVLATAETIRTPPAYLELPAGGE